MFGYYFFIFLANCEVIAYTMLWYSIVVGWIDPDMDLWILCVVPTCILRHRQSLEILSAYVLICTHLSILLYLSPSSW